MEDQVLAKIKELLTEFEVDASEVNMDSEFETLGLDSLDLVELSVKVEDSFGLEIEEDDLKEVVTVGDAVRLVLAKQGVSP
jgi:acyl carrier protein